MGTASGLGASAFTLEVWFHAPGSRRDHQHGNRRRNQWHSPGDQGAGQAENSNRDMNYFLGICATDNVLVADFEEGASGSAPGSNHPIVGVTAVISNTWNHAAVTYDGTNWNLYLNGQLERSLAVGQPPRSDSIQYAGLGSAMTSRARRRAISTACSTRRASGTTRERRSRFRIAKGRSDVRHGIAGALRPERGQRHRGREQCGRLCRWRTRMARRGPPDIPSRKRVPADCSSMERMTT